MSVTKNIKARTDLHSLHNRSHTFAAISTLDILLVGLGRSLVPRLVELVGQSVARSLHAGADRGAGVLGDFLVGFLGGAAHGLVDSVRERESVSVYRR